MEETITGGLAAERDEATRVLRWRWSQLVAAGFDREAAAGLAGHLEVDLHQARELLACGCPPATATRILL